MYFICLCLCEATAAVQKKKKLSCILQLFDLVWGGIWGYTVKEFCVSGALCVRL